jgi:acetyltransferase-like isoleucine patch superfamily enzyme
MKNNRQKKWKKPEFDEKNLTKWNWMCQHPEKMQLGDFVDIGAFTYINAQYGVIIEKNVQIGSHCSIYSVSTIDNKKGKIVIKENARIGTHSTIMPNVIIGKNTIIGAYSFVTTNIPDDVIAYGIPVKIFKKVNE